MNTPRWIFAAGLWAAASLCAQAQESAKPAAPKLGDIEKSLQKTLQELKDMAPKLRPGGKGIAFELHFDQNPWQIVGGGPQPRIVRKLQGAGSDPKTKDEAKFMEGLLKALSDKDGKGIVILLGNDPVQKKKATDSAEDTLARLLKELGDLKFKIQVQAAPPAPKKEKIEIKELKIELVPMRPASDLEKKVDRLLKEMEEMRRDIKGLKESLAKRPEGKGLFFQFVPAKPAPGKESEGAAKRAEDKALRDLEAARDILQREVQAKEAALKNELERIRTAKEQERKQRQPDRIEQIDRTIERLLQELESLRREVRKGKN